VTARLSFETPARLSLAALERLTFCAVYSGRQHYCTPVQRSERHTTPAKRHDAVRLRRARVETVNSMSVQIDGDRTVVRLPGSRCLSRREG
jgi:hypothetical protein